MKHVTKETAVLLKEKGFDLPCRQYYDHREEAQYTFDNNFINCNKHEIMYSAPYYQTVLEWLREKGVHVYVKANWGAMIWFGIISTYANTRYTANFDTHDLALEAGIVHALKYLP